MIKAITFDLDNTLWETDSVIRNAEKVTFDWLEKNHPKLTATFSTADLYALRESVIEGNPSLIAHISQLRIETLAKAFQLVGYEAEHATAISKQAFEVFIDARHDIELYPDTLQTLKRLQHYLIGAVTNGNASVKRLGLNSYFNFVFSAESVGFKKPHPEIYHAVIEHTGLKAHEIVHIGDHHEDDILGAKKVGIKTIWVNLKLQEWPLENQFRADFEVQNLSQIPEIITRF